MNILKKIYNSATSAWEDVFATPTPESLAPYAKVTDLTAETERAEAAEAAIIPSKWETVPTITINNGIKYGRLYNWYAATDVRGIAPVGWHVPSDTEWQTLIDYLGGGLSAKSKLKEVGILHWDAPNIDATNESEFTALPSGTYASDQNGFRGIGFCCLWWSATEYDETQALYRDLYWNSSNLVSYPNYKSFGMSIRLIKDNSINEGDIIIDGDTYHAVTIGTQVWLQQNLTVTHYQNGDVIGSDFSGTVGAVTAYNNDESNVYDIVQVEDLTHIQPKDGKRIHASIIDELPVPDLSDYVTEEQFLISQTAQQEAVTDETTRATAAETAVVTQLVDGAETDSNTLNKLATQIANLKTIIGGTTPNGDGIIDTFQEIVNLLSAIPEGANLGNLLSAKANVSDIYNALDYVLAGKFLDARQGKVLNDAIMALNTALTNISLTPGQNGVTPHIGTNKNWFVGTEDTGVTAQGAPGTSVPVNIAFFKTNANGVVPITNFSWYSNLVVSRVILNNYATDISVTINGTIYNKTTLIGVALNTGTQMLLDMIIQTGYNSGSAIIIF